jgi:hypothetical protein
MHFMIAAQISPAGCKITLIILHLVDECVICAGNPKIICSCSLTYLITI